MKKRAIRESRRKNRCSLQERFRAGGTIGYYTVASLLVILLSAFNANAQLLDPDRNWKDGEITQVKNRLGDIKDVTDDIKLQLNDLKAKGFVIRDSAKDILDWLAGRRDEYVAFVGSNRCDGASPCGLFRSDLIIVAHDMSLLSDVFPAIQKLGLGDGDFFMRLVNNAPPIVLFTLNQIMNRAPDWKQIPRDLLSIFDEIGDPDVFEIQLAPRSSDASLAFASTAASFALASNQSPTQRFCERKADQLDREIDPVRLNRLRFIVFYMKTLSDLFGEVVTEDVEVTVAGEGTDFINPVAAFFKTIKASIEIIENGVETYLNNLDICRNKQREMELQVAQCLMLVDFVMPSTRDEIFNFVRTEIKNAEREFLPVRKAESFLEQAKKFRQASRWKEAYQMLCQAYQKIGES